MAWRKNNRMQMYYMYAYLHTLQWDLFQSYYVQHMLNLALAHETITYIELFTVGKQKAHRFAYTPQ